MEEKKIRKHRTNAEKYEIIEFYEVFEGERGAKEKTIKAFKLSSTSILNTILQNREHITRTHESNSTSTKSS